MKKLTCDICDHTESAETFNQWMEAMKPHYAQAHADFMKEKSQLSPEQQQKEMMVWMNTNKDRFESTE